MKIDYRFLLRYLSIYIAVTLIVYAVNKSIQISIVVGAITSTFSYLMERKSQHRLNSQIRVLLPEIIDSLISGIQSGMSLVEALSSLAERGPIPTRYFFDVFKNAIHSGQSFEKAIGTLQDTFKDRIADQFFEAILLAKALGGGNLLYLLRQLGDFTRQDLSFRLEVEGKQGWVRNSAHVAAVAPWLLLLMLSLQPSTAASYSSSSGFMVILFGALVTILAYLWMESLARIPEPRRIFGVEQ